MPQLIALILSLLLEVPVAVAAARRWGHPERRAAWVALAATLITHPFAWNGFGALRPYLPYVARAVVIEGGVALFEGALYAVVLGLGWRRGLLLGLLANATSYGVGLVLYRTGVL